MFGYVRPAMNRLPAEERERFHSAYCGLCHTLGRRYGPAARFLLNFDFTFLAILLSTAAAPACRNRRCVVHPCKGCAVMDEHPAFAAAADYSVVLTWWQLQDHIADHSFFSGIKYRVAALFLRSAYKKAQNKVPAFDAQVQRHLRELGELEASRCDSLDAAAEPFAALLAELAQVEPCEERRRIFRQIFYHLGRWIYLIDAADDYAQDARDGNYNPIRYRYRLTEPALTAEIRCALGDTLDASIRQMYAAYALLEPGIWTAVLDSIFYDSLYAIGKAVLDGTYHKPSRTHKAIKTEGKPV